MISIEDAREQEIVLAFCSESGTSRTRQNGNGGSMLPTYTESLRIGWMVFWRGAGGFVATFLVVALATPVAAPGRPSNPLGWAPLIIAVGLSVFVWIPFLLVEYLFRKQFRGFYLTLVRGTRSADVEASQDQAT